MDCPWYLGLQATEECLKACTITKENRDTSICPDIISEDDSYLDITQNGLNFLYGYMVARSSKE